MMMTNNGVNDGKGPQKCQSKKKKKQKGQQKMLLQQHTSNNNDTNNSNPTANNDNKWQWQPKKKRKLQQHINNVLQQQDMFGHGKNSDSSWVQWRLPPINIMNPPLDIHHNNDHMAPLPFNHLQPPLFHHPLPLQLQQWQHCYPPPQLLPPPPPRHMMYPHLSTSHLMNANVNVDNVSGARASQGIPTRKSQLPPLLPLPPGATPLQAHLPHPRPINPQCHPPDGKWPPPHGLCYVNNVFPYTSSITTDSSPLLSSSGLANNFSNYDAIYRDNYNIEDNEQDEDENHNDSDFEYVNYNDQHEEGSYLDLTPSPNNYTNATLCSPLGTFSSIRTQLTYHHGGRPTIKEEDPDAFKTMTSGLHRMDKSPTDHGLGGGYNDGLATIKSMHVANSVEQRQLEKRELLKEGEIGAMKEVERDDGMMDSKDASWWLACFLASKYILANYPASQLPAPASPTNI